jgi:serine phosphatase RsbU (regulator of sigma subunit)/anti-sigma regulatory factor (Ser/Thr protein kinase)
VPELAPTVDFSALLAALPQPALLIGPQLTVQAASLAFLQATGNTAAGVLQAPVATLPGCLSSQSQQGLAQHDIPASIQRVFDTGRAEQLPAIAYHLTSPGNLAPLGPRWCSVSNVPITDARGQTAYVLYLARDITDLVAERRRGQRLRQREEQLAERAQSLQSDYRQRLTTILQSAGSVPLLPRSGQPLTVAQLAAELATAQSIAEVTEVIIGRGVTAMNATSGALALREDRPDVLHLTRRTLNSGTAFEQLHTDDQLPIAVAAAGSDSVYLSNSTEIKAWLRPPVAADNLEPVAAIAALPLLVDGRSVGAIELAWLEPQTFGEAERRTLSHFATVCGQAVDRVQAQSAQRQALDSSRLLAEALQRSLLELPPTSELADVAVRYRPASNEAQIGGDWYDAFELAGTLHLVVGDVVGHHRAAAAAMAQLRGLLRGIAHCAPPEPHLIATGLDRALADLSIDTIASAVIGQLGPGPTEQTRTLRWTNAGHPPPLVLLPDGTARLLQSEPELLFGVNPKSARTSHDLELPAGASVLFYSDGLIERRSESLDCGLDWLVRRVRALHGLPLGALCDALLAELPAEREDDVALLALRVPPSARPPAVIDLRDRVGQLPVGLPGAASPVPQVIQRAALALTPDLAAVRRARAFVRQQCAAAQVSADTTDTVELLTSETVTNAFIHGRSEARLAILISMGTIRIEVGDDNARHPLRATRNNEALDGRGLDILELLSAEWGVFDEPGGKVVWFELSDCSARQLAQTR